MAVSLAYAMKGQNETEKEAFRWFSAFNAELIRSLDKHEISETEASERLDMGVAQLLAIAKK